jgi:sugar O-acyltransferase (sialic acid O-acetyltransferase NeuD family)
VTLAVGIVGAGDQARETAGYVLDSGGEVRWFAVEEQYLPQAEKDERLPAVVLTLDEAHALDRELPVIVALGYPGDRRRLAGAWPGHRFETLICERTWLAPGVDVGAGAVVCPGAVITAGSSLGRHVLVNVGATISHDCRIGDFVTVSPGAHLAGHVSVGDGTFVGIGAVISDRISIGEGCLIGAGAVVVRDVVEGSVVMGVPGRVVRWLDAWPA